MNEEQRQVSRFQAQPKGPGGVPLGPFFRLAALLVAYLEPPNCAPSALPDGKMTSSSGGDETSTDPKDKS
ncbi:hypothetical protein [Zhongshania sp.]|jgi:hypothetical protein|uniref:hypothetical protein n=1 Tax=Zhongshania sp. TaxID=1971902 RepID=UPI001B680694|nr:hypothetical protein [Zhongshania sp.]MBQ0796943.1 hypothetical protein [Zhongshania sp.]|tara:strand:- start:1010 stop:1219 length:210 start_codon:yes stop_codon:yes gene_type:complete